MARSPALIASLLVALAIPAAAAAQEWPSRPIRFIVPYPAGGSTDVGARAIADSLSRSLGQQIVVENKSGASGNVGFEAAAHSAPDGYTVLIGPDQVASAPHVFKVTFDPRKDFAPVIQLSRQPVVLAVHPKLGAASVSELIALTKQHPGLSYATSGVGSQQHMTAEWFAQIAGIKLEHVPYRGGGQAINDLIAGHIQIGSLGLHRSSRTTRPVRCVCLRSRRWRVRRACRTCQLIRKRASRGWCSISGLGSSSRRVRRQQ